MDGKKIPDPAAPTDRSVGGLIILVVAIVLPSIITWIYFFAAERATAGAQIAVFNVVKILQFVLPAAWVLGVERGRVTLRPQSARGVGTGLAFGAVVLAAAMSLYFGFLRSWPAMADAAVEMRTKLSGWHVAGPWKYAALGLFYSVVHSLLEEYYWRWFVYGQLRRRMPPAPAIAISAMGFAAHHVLVLGKFFGFASPATWLLSACVAIGGAVWAWLYERSGSLLGPWLSHMLVDAAIFLAGYDLVRRLWGG